jgi:tRNA 2-thiocytidine biosynthesis protein TtcA
MRNCFFIKNEISKILDEISICNNALNCEKKGDVVMVDFQHVIAIKVRKQIVQALNDFSMMAKNDHWMVCVSGGKDSSILLALLTEIQRKSPIQFTFEAVILDQKQPGFDVNKFKSWVESLNVKLTVLQKDTYSIVKEKVVDKAYCSLCSRLRRGILYGHAERNGFTKLALGHHRDDLLETLLLNLFFTGRLASMPAKLLSDDEKNILVRPLVYVSESDLECLSKDWQIPIIPCNLCGTQEGLRRNRIKKLLNELESEIPDLRNSMMGALGNVHKSQLLDHSLWNFEELGNIHQLPDQF